MTTSDEVRQTALDLAERGVETDPAVQELLDRTGDHRVAVVRARQTLAEDGEGDAVARATELLDLALERGTWT